MKKNPIAASCASELIVVVESIESHPGHTVMMLTTEPTKNSGATMSEDYHVSPVLKTVRLRIGRHPGLVFIGGDKLFELLLDDQPSCEQVAQPFPRGTRLHAITFEARGVPDPFRV